MNSPTPHPLPDAALSPERLAEIRAHYADLRVDFPHDELYHHDQYAIELLAALDAQAAQVAGLKQELADQEAEKLALTKDVLFFRASLATAEAALVRAAIAT